MRRGPEKFFDDIIATLKCSTTEAYRMTVDRFSEPLFNGYAFFERTVGKYVALNDDGQETGVAISGPSDSDVSLLRVVNVLEQVILTTNFHLLGRDSPELCPFVEHLGKGGRARPSHPR